MSSEQFLIAKEDMHNFMVRCITAVGTCEDHANILADCLTTADYRGHFSHGLNRLHAYIRDIQEAHCKKEGSPEIIKESAATAYVDGKNLLGVVVGKFCMELAIKKAKEEGIGWVVCKGSNHFGTADYYTLMASRQALLGFCCTNTSPLVATVGGKKPFFGTNPLSVAVAGKENEFVLDMATSVTAYGKVEMKARKGESIPDSWAIDENGKPTTDPKKFSALLPLGGLPQNGGFKGTGLAMMAEIFSSVLSGAKCAPNVRRWSKIWEGPADLGHCFFALNPEFFAPGFKERMEQLILDVISQEPAEGVKEVMVAGEPEFRHEKLCDCLGGIPYHSSHIEMLKEFAVSLNIEPPKIIATAI